MPTVILLNVISVPLGHSTHPYRLFFRSNTTPIFVVAHKFIRQYVSICSPEMQLTEFGRNVLLSCCKTARSLCPFPRKSKFTVSWLRIGNDTRRGRMRWGRKGDQITDNRGDKNSSSLRFHRQSTTRTTRGDGRFRRLSSFPVLSRPPGTACVVLNSC